jgi:hypothetical protein
MRKLVFSLSLSVVPLFLGVFLPYVPFPGDVRFVNMPWGVVYGAGFFLIDLLGAFHQTQPSALRSRTSYGRSSSRVLCS